MDDTTKYRLMAEGYIAKGKRFLELWDKGRLNFTPAAGERVRVEQMIVHYERRLAEILARSLDIKGRAMDADW